VYKHLNISRSGTPEYISQAFYKQFLTVNVKIYLNSVE